MLWHSKNNIIKWIYSHRHWKNIYQSAILTIILAKWLQPSSWSCIVIVNWYSSLEIFVVLHVAPRTCARIQKLQEWGLTNGDATYVRTPQTPWRLQRVRQLVVQWTMCSALPRKIIKTRPWQRNSWSITNWYLLLQFFSDLTKHVLAKRREVLKTNFWVFKRK